MLDNKKILAIIPARGGSKTLPRKNIKELAGKPLISWPIQEALKSKYIDKVIVSTDDNEIAKIAADYGAEIPFIRPSKYANDSSPSSDFILHALNFFTNEYDYFVLLEPTSPLTDSIDIDLALEKMHAKKAGAIVSVAKNEACHPFYCVTLNHGFIEPYNNSDFEKPTRRQDLETIYYFDGSLYISDVKTYLKEKTFYHNKTLAFEFPAWKAISIDTLLDFILVETILNNKDKLINQE